MYIISNPVAGKGIAAAALKTVLAALDAEGVAYTSAETERPGHATTLAREAAAGGEKLVLVIGGDGTIGEVAAGLLGTGTALGIIPAGSGNDLVKALKIPLDPLSALEIARHGQVRPMDTCTANGKSYSNIAGFGFDVDVLVKTDYYMGIGYTGSRAYRKGLFSSLAHLDHRQTHITWVDEKGERHEMDRNLLILAACNGTNFGGGMAVAPKADPFDGMLDICVIHDVHWWNVWFVLPLFLKGKHLGLKCVDYFHAVELTAVAEPESRI